MAAFVILVGTWITLNHFRAQYYNDPIEGPSPQTSPYWTIIRAQDILCGPIAVTALCVVVLVLFIVAHYVKLAIFNREGSVKR